mgnify:CR=1 FL=1
MKSLLIENEDLVVEGGKPKFGDVDNQNIYYLLVAAKGTFPEDRTAGAELRNYLNGNVPITRITRFIKRELIRYGISTRRVSVSNDGIFIQ